MTIKNRTLQLHKEGKTTVGMFLGVPSYDVVELLSGIGLDWITFDLEHGSYQYELLPWLLAAASKSESTPMVRVPALDPVYVKLALDRGALGIVFPMIETEEEALTAVASCKYPPLGKRGIGPRRASFYFSELADYLRNANNEIMVTLIIESKKGVENIDRILSVPGIDSIMLGHLDLAASMGHIGSLPVIPKDVEDSMMAVFEKSKSRGIPVGVDVSDDASIQLRIKQGFKMLCLPDEMAYLKRAKEDMLKVRKLTGRN